MQIGVLGGGSWATAIVKILLNNSDHLNWWMRNQNSVDYINKFHHNPSYLQSVDLETEKLTVSTDLEEIVHDPFNLTVFPNPFSQNLNIELDLLNSESISIQLFDVNGHLVNTFFENKLLAQGKHHLKWNQQRVSPGVYFLRLNNGYKVDYKKVIRM